MKIQCLGSNYYLLSKCILMLIKINSILLVLCSLSFLSLFSLIYAHAIYGFVIKIIDGIIIHIMYLIVVNSLMFKQDALKWNSHDPGKSVLSYDGYGFLIKSFVMFLFVTIMLVISII